MKDMSIAMVLESTGFKKVKNMGGYPNEGTLYKVPEEMAEGYYWIYIHEDLFDIKIHDFYYHKDTVFELNSGAWPKCLNIAYYKSVSGEEFNPYRHLMAGCVKTFFGGSNSFKSVFHKKIPLRSIGIEIFPDYYENYLQKMYGDEYIDPTKAFHTIDQTQNFPEMTAILKQIWNYRGSGMSAKLFYEAKVAEAVSLMIDYSKKNQSNKFVVSPEDQRSISNVTEYIHDHFNCNISLEYLAKISCMGTTKLKTTFKAVYHCSITQYIKERRLSHAENLLSTTNLTIEQISQAVGYRNSGRFASIFKENSGLYPAEYRKSCH
ncbi:MAG: helix-turn-helix domain-containing protein [Velocimicrobium sp.]